jgi:hypothetical protein
MFNNDFWEEIKTNYPVSYEDFENWITRISNLNNEYEACYCDIETYFDGVGIIITFCYDEVKKYLPELKKNYSSSFMTSLQKNADKSQKWPLLKADQASS